MDRLEISISPRYCGWLGLYLSASQSLAGSLIDLGWIKFRVGLQHDAVPTMSIGG